MQKLLSTISNEIADKKAAINISEIFKFNEDLP